MSYRRRETVDGNVDLSGAPPRVSEHEQEAIGASTAAKVGLILHSSFQISFVTLTWICSASVEKATNWRAQHQRQAAKD